MQQLLTNNGFKQGAKLTLNHRKSSFSKVYSVVNVNQSRPPNNLCTRIELQFKCSVRSNFDNISGMLQIVGTCTCRLCYNYAMSALFARCYWKLKSCSRLSLRCIVHLHALFELQVNGHDRLGNIGILQYWTEKIDRYKHLIKHSQSHRFRF